MKSRRKVAIYIDYALRVPNFVNSYNVFKESLFSDKEQDFDTEDEISENDVRFYWIEQMKNPEIEKFYFSKQAPKTDEELCGQSLSSYFFNREHENKFFDDYSFNLYSDAKVPNSQDVDVINVAQEHLFDVVLVDEYRNKRKKSNTMFFLSKIRAYPQSVLFLGEGQKLNTENYFAIWNPALNTHNQVNKPGDKTFIEWFKSLEEMQKNMDND